MPRDQHDEMWDAFAFQGDGRYDQDATALQLVLRMLSRENQLRLSPETCASASGTIAAA